MAPREDKDAPEDFHLIDDHAYDSWSPPKPPIGQGSVRLFGEITQGVINSRRFVVGRKLGEGHNGVVYTARDQRTGEYGAIKLLSPSEIALAQREYRNLDDESVLRRESRFQPASNVLPSVVFEDDDRKPFLWMPQCVATLEEVIGWGSSDLKLFRELQIEYIQDIAHGLREFHVDFGRVHGDLNPTNLMDYHPAGLVGRRIVIADTGTATYVSPEEWSKSPRDNMGHVAIRAPELFREGSHPTTQSDVWSVGALAVKLLSGQYPTQKRIEESKDPFSVMRDIGKHEYEGLVEDALSDVPKAFRSFLRECLAYDPSERPENGEILEKKLEKAIKKYERSKPRSRLLQACLIGGITSAFVLGAVPIIDKFVDLNSKKVSLEKKLESDKEKTEFDRKGTVVSIVLNGGKDRAIDTLNLNTNNYYAAKEFRGWLDLLKDPRTATAAYFDPRATYEAVMKAGGSTNYDDIRPILTDMDSKAWQAVVIYADPSIDNFIRFPQHSAFHDPYDKAKERWEFEKDFYEAKKKLDEEQGEGTADRVLKERKERLKDNR